MARYHSRTLWVSFFLAVITACSVEYLDKRADSGEPQAQRSSGDGKPSGGSNGGVNTSQGEENSEQVQENPQTVGETPTPAPTSAPKPTATPVPSNPNVRGLLQLVPGTTNKWKFTIPAGKAADPWNSGKPFELHPGETLLIYADEAGHGFHTGGKPCRHGGDRQYDANGNMLTFNSTGQIQVGGHFECDITAANAITSNTAVYDHTKGPGAVIEMDARPN